MDVDRLLNLEKRTGIKDADIEGFIRKADAVEKALKGMLDGSVNPDSVVIEGLETEEQKRQKEEELAEKRRKYLEKEAELKRQRKREERERWWAGAEAYFPKSSTESQSSSVPGSNKKLSADDKKSLKVARYTMDYSKWDSWTPSDDVSRQEELEREAEEEKRRNEEFEKNNPDFCKQFMDDMNERKKGTQKKQEIADSCRLKGNKYFKARDYPRALEAYMEGLKSNPFDPKLLLNIAQAQIKVKDYEDGLEFLKRTLYLDAANVKALSRQAFVLAEQGETAEALISITQALHLEPQNDELLAQHREISIVEQEKKAEEIARSLKSQAESKVSGGITTKDNSKVEIAKNTSTWTQEEFFLRIDELKIKCAEYLAQTAAVDTNKPHGDTLYREFLPIVTAFPVDTLNVNGQNSVVRAYFRTSETLPTVLSTLKTMWSQEVKRSLTSQSTETSNSMKLSETESAFHHLFNVLSHLIRGERSGKQYILDQKFISLIVKDIVISMHHEMDLFVHAIIGNQTFSSVKLSAWLSILQSIFQFLSHCSEDDTNHKMRIFLWQEKSLLVSTGLLIGTLVSLSALLSWQPQRFSAITATWMTQTDQVLIEIVQYWQHQLQEESGRAAIQELCQADPSVGLLITCAVGTLVQEILKCTQTPTTTRAVSEVTAWWERLLVILLGVSQLECLRPHFTVPLPRSPVSAGSSSTPSVSTVHLLVQALRYPTHVQVSNLLAVLLNISVSSAEAPDTALQQPTVRQVMIDAGIMSFLLPTLILPSSSAVSPSTAATPSSGEEDEEDVLCRNRCAGVLSRVVVVPSVTSLFLQEQPEVYYGGLCRRFTYLVDRCVRLSKKQLNKELSSTRVDKWLYEEMTHSLRTLAAIPTSIPGQHNAAHTRAQLSRIAKDHGVVPALLALFPEPRRDGGEITPTSVTLMPVNVTEIPSAILLGNAARCLLHYSDEVITAQEIFMQESLLGIEKLICGMATITDIRVRRNISIVLAKGIKTMGTQPNGQRVRERITHYRGLQMMIQLQSQL